MTPLFILFFILVIAVFVATALTSYKKKSAEEKGPEAPLTPPVFASSDASLRDPVTQLYNYKHLLRRLQEITARMDRENKTMAVILWDIDGFVRFNNEFGQKEGDKFLWKVADSIKKTLRVYDEAFRSGPDEFCAVSAPADEVITRDVADRVKTAVSKELFEEEPEYRGQKFALSYGLVFYPGFYKVPEALLHAAQQDLYKYQRTPIPELF